ncbi:MAG: dockerin type I domain-containing protein [Verrucomicrobiota bacterium]|nr:dockerin type I domain-containing protein [Verrucomicrobiota bacterium]
MTVLQGDANGDSSVNAADSFQTRSRAGLPVDATTFRSDVNTDGSVNAADVQIVRALSGHGV